MLPGGWPTNHIQDGLGLAARPRICHPERRTRFLQAGAVLALLVALAVGPRKTKPASRGFLVLRLRLG